MRFKLRNLQANEPDEHATSPKLRCPKAESMPLEMRFDSVQHGTALFLRQRPSKEFHHMSVSIHTGERLPVGVAPRAQGEALGGDSHLVHDTQIGLIVALIFHVRMDELESIKSQPARRRFRHPGLHETLRAVGGQASLHLPFSASLPLAKSPFEFCLSNGLFAGHFWMSPNHDRSRSFSAKAANTAATTSGRQQGMRFSKTYAPDCVRRVAKNIMQRRAHQDALPRTAINVSRDLCFVHSIVNSRFLRPRWPPQLQVP
jgi:hypothetical protein